MKKNVEIIQTEDLTLIFHALALLLISFTSVSYPSHAIRRHKQKFTPPGLFHVAEMGKNIFKVLRLRLGKVAPTLCQRVCGVPAPYDLGPQGEP